MVVELVVAVSVLHCSTQLFQGVLRRVEPHNYVGTTRELPWAIGGKKQFKIQSCCVIKQKHAKARVRRWSWHPWNRCRTRQHKLVLEPLAEQSYWNQLLCRVSRANCATTILGHRFRELLREMEVPTPEQELYLQSAVGAEWRKASILVEAAT